jgi:predicted small lipoprotein YifL
MQKTGFKTVRRLLLISAMALAMGACGMKGDLYLPEPAQPAAQSQQDKQSQKTDKEGKSVPDAATTE